MKRVCHDDPVVLSQGMRAARLEAMSSQWVEILLAVGTVLVLWFGVEDARANPPKGTPGDLILYFFYLRTLYKPIRDFGRLASRAAKAAASAERIMEIMTLQPDIADSPNAKSAPPLKGRIEFNNVHFRYHESTPVLRGVSFQIEPGEKVAVLGASGAGKTSLCSLLPRFYDPTSGFVQIDGMNVEDFTLRSLRRQVSLVMQESLLFGCTVAENISFGRPDASEEQIIRAARRAQAHDFIQALPDGYNTVIAERGLSLSEGQKQRLALARAFLKKAPILILDEPTSNVDIKSERAIIRAISKLMENTTTLMITHNVKMIHFVDRIIVLDKGRVIENGSHAELIAAGGAYARMIGMQTALGTAEKINPAAGTAAP